MHSLNFINLIEHSAIRNLFSFLYPFSLLYSILVRVWLLLHKQNILKKERLSGYVVSVGNLTLGGTGKTSFCIYIVDALKRMGLKGVVLSRGYKAKRKKHLVLPDDNPRDYGDEPVLLARKTKVPIIIGKNRIKTGNEALDRFNPDVLLLDDGFQYLKLHRDLDILLIDMTSPFGYSKFPPSGLLREPLSSIARADVVVLTRADDITNNRYLFEKIKKLNPNGLIVKSIHSPTTLYNLRLKKNFPLSYIRGKKVLAFSSIGNPTSFIRTLSHLGADVVRELPFPDHYLYKETDFKKIERIVSQCKADMIVTTEKDSVKISRIPFQIFVLKVETKIIEGEESFFNLFFQKLRSQSSLYLNPPLLPPQNQNSFP